MAKNWTADEIRMKLATSDAWLTRGVLAIYARQTADERSAEATNHNNGVGFNGTDAKILSSFAKQILAWQDSANRKYPTPLSPKQIAIARAKMAKYARQLARIASETADGPAGDPSPARADLENTVCEGCEFCDGEGVHSIADRLDIERAIAQRHGASY